jgi:hypothetical protein
MAGEPDIRASDAERERVATRLREYAAEGRLDVDELDERLQQAYSARTRGELERLTTDLPSAPAPQPRPPAQPADAQRSWGVRERVGAYVGVMALLIVIWAVTGAGSFWPIWPAIGWAIALLTGRDRHFGRRGPGRHRLL